MAITSVGYDGQVNEVQWAKMASLVGTSDYGVAGILDWKVSAHPTTSQAVNVNTGAGWGHGVYDVSDAVVTVICPTISSGTRWDLIVANRNWSGPGGSTTFNYVQGTSARALPAYTKNPGSIDQQPLALVQWTAGQTQPTAIVDLRCWAGTGFIMAMDNLALQYLNRLGTEVQIGQTNWRYVFDSNGIAQWTQLGARVITFGRTGPFSEPGSSGTTTAFNISRINVPDPGFPYQIVGTAVVEGTGGGAGTRWDVAIEVSGFGAIANGRGDAMAPFWTVSGISTGAPLVGAQTVTLVAHKIFGSGNFGLSAFNQFFSAMVVPV